ncbi:MAG: ACP S-malonyltransferase [Trueperaceae bacterium]
MRIAALFPGQGSHAVGMGRALHDASPAARAVLDRAEAALPGLRSIMFGGPSEELTRTAIQQPALVAAGAAAYAAWREAGGPQPLVAAGHSLGEFTAHVASGSLEIETAIRLVHARGRYMQEAVAEGVGAMAAVLKLDDAVVRELCTAAGDGVEIANLNAPGQVVVSGTAEAVAAVAEAAKTRGGRAVPLKVSAPFHCRLMRPAAERLALDLERTSFSEPAFPIVRNVDAEPSSDPADAPRTLTEQVTGAVRWTEVQRVIEAIGVDRWIEFGHGKVLTNMLARTVPSADGRPVHDPASLAAALASDDEGGSP